MTELSNAEEEEKDYWAKAECTGRSFPCIVNILDSLQCSLWGVLDTNICRRKETTDWQTRPCTVVVKWRQIDRWREKKAIHNKHWAFSFILSWKAQSHGTHYNTWPGWKVSTGFPLKVQVPWYTSAHTSVDWTISMKYKCDNETLKCIIFILHSELNQLYMYCDHMILHMYNLKRQYAKIFSA